MAVTELNAMEQTGLGGSRNKKDSDKGFFYTKNDTPILAGSGIALEYFDLTTGATIDPNLIPWNSSTKYGLKISVE
jgi:hypothetical protein